MPHLPHPAGPVPSPLCGLTQLGQLYAERGDLSPQEEEDSGSPRACALALKARGWSPFQAWEVKGALPPHSPSPRPPPPDAELGWRPRQGADSESPMVLQPLSHGLIFPNNTNRLLPGGQCSLPHPEDLGDDHIRILTRTRTPPAWSPCWGGKHFRSPQQCASHPRQRRGQASLPPPHQESSFYSRGTPNRARCRAQSLKVPGPQKRWGGGGEAAR